MGEVLRLIISQWTRSLFYVTYNTRYTSHTRLNPRDGMEFMRTESTSRGITVMFRVSMLRFPVFGSAIQ